MTAFLFDLDGTLADSIDIILQSSRMALEELGYPQISDAQITSLIGVPLLDTGERILGPGLGELYRECYQKHFLSLDIGKLNAFPGLAKTLAHLKAQGGKLACVTSKRRFAAESSLKAIGLADYFSALVCAESTEQHKPAAEPAHKALAMLNACAEKAIFIGDSIFDIGCARNAGILSCGVLWGAGNEQELTQAGADYIAHTVGELDSILDSQLL
ncbi:MAG: HAD-IA family hydrolase [Clostridiales bacterium]|nr:HAD-IA family hydrolase [Clostridiales bacterium]